MALVCCKIKTQVIHSQGIVPDADDEAAERGLGIKPQEKKAEGDNNDGKIIKIYLVGHIDGHQARDVERRNVEYPDSHPPRRLPPEISGRRQR